jgi:hypothetical protein
MDEALDFARSRQDWIRGILAQQPKTVGVRMGTRIAFQDRMLKIAAAEVRAARIEGDFLFVPPDPGRVAPRVLAFLKARARARLQAASERYAEMVGRKLGQISLRDPRSRWGSCTAKGDIMYSWRLIMAPPEVLDYVAAHEVAHLREMNHSPSFWRLVGRLCPDWEVHREWLRREGDKLHRYIFSE